MDWVQRLARGLVLLVAAGFGSGCTTALVLVHLHDTLTEGDPPGCSKLSSVERALRPRCGDYVAGSLLEKDIVASGLPECPLTLAARDPRHWRVLPELLARGAQPERCGQPPLVALAHADACPNFQSAPDNERKALRWLAEADIRSVHHDVVRMLSCPNSRAAGLDVVLEHWAGAQVLPQRGLPFSPLGALHPGYLGSEFARRLEAQGHDPRSALGAYVGELPSGFELALQAGDWQALDWWLVRVPELVHRSPPSRGGQLPWVPLARVLTPGYIADEALRRSTVEYLLAHGADPWTRLPHDPDTSVVGYARALNSPLLVLLDPPLAAGASRDSAATGVAAGARAR
jgi:hypothetical protein